MSISPVNSASPTPTTTPAPVTTNTRAADGDYKVRNASTTQVKDSDGDYASLPKSPAATSSSAVQAALTNLKPGG